MKYNYFYADYIYHNKDFAQCVPLKVGLKVRVNQQMLSELQSSEYINQKFTLEIKRLNRWYWSVYFAEKGE